MAHDRKKHKKETDANEVIRRYVESDQAHPDLESDREHIEWYEQAKQNTQTPPQAVLTGGDLDAAWDQAEVRG